MQRYEKIITAKDETFMKKKRVSKGKTTRFIHDLSTEGAIYFLNYVRANKPICPADSYNPSNAADLEMIVRSIIQIQDIMRIHNQPSRSKKPDLDVSGIAKGNYFMEIGYHNGIPLIKPTGRTSLMPQRKKQHLKIYENSKITIALPHRYTRAFEGLVLDMLEIDGANAVRISSSDLGEIYQITEKFSLEYFYEIHERAEGMWKKLLSNQSHIPVASPSTSSLAERLKSISELKNKQVIDQDGKVRLKTMLLANDTRIEAAYDLYQDNQNIEELHETLYILSKL